MKNVITRATVRLMLGLVASTASFAQSTADQNPDVIVSSFNQKVRVYVAPQSSTATIQLTDAQGHVLYTHTENVAKGMWQKLNLTELEPGTYRLSILKAGQAVEKTVVIEEVPSQKQVTLKA